MDATLKAELDARLQELKVAAPVAKGKDKTKGFCVAWPAAKATLEMLAEIAKKRLLKAAIKAVISIGDTIAKLVCK